MAGAVHIPGIEIDAELGHGSYSAVYRGRRGNALCAVKVPRVRGRWTRWVYREAVALARVRHPGLPAVIEVGEVGEVPFLVMELVEGETLADRLRLGPMGEGEALRLIASLAEALGAVHGAGLVHRDVKPRNIVLERSGTVRLVDFGFAVPADRLAGHDAAGTPGYTAPEQFRNPSQIDGRADLYAVGQVLHECLTGRIPRPDPDGERGAAGFGTAGDPRVSESIGVLLGGLRAHDPHQRYPDVWAVLREIDLLRAGRAVLGPAGCESLPRVSGALIGREVEMGEFRRLWEGLRASGGSAFVLEGPRGSGKTRLLRAFASVVREGREGRVLEAQCRDQDPPLAVLRRILEAFVASLGRTSRGDRAADEAALRAAAADHLGDFATLIAPKLVSVLGAPAASVEAAPGGFPEGAAELIARLARSAGPLVICVDDAHWVDPISRQVLLRLAHKAAQAPVLLVFSVRQPAASSTPLVELAAERTSRRRLLPFDERSVAALVASHLGASELKPELSRRIALLAGGTPLGVLEVLGAMLDLGAVRPREGGWIIDAARMDSVALPDGSVALLAGRVAELHPETRRVLETAAILGAAFADQALARVVDVDEEALASALADARQAGVLEPAEDGSHRFVHDTAREMLAGGLGEPDRRRLHLRIAETMGGDGADAEAILAAAEHYRAAGVGDAAPRAQRIALAAADISLHRFDNETALRYLDLARCAAASAGSALGASFHRDVGEARLRLGALDDSLDAFQEALLHQHDPSARASIEGRIAWVHQARAAPDEAWAALDRAFRALGSRMPVEGVGSAVGALARFVAGVTRRGSAPLAPPNATLLCDLHYQNARLGLEYAKPYRFVASAAEALRVSEALGPSRAQARSRALYGLVLTSLGMPRRGARELGLAEAMADALGDRVAIARCTQTRAATAGLAGDTDLALELLRECLDVHGAWLELNEYCLNAGRGDLLESFRGKPVEAWAWIERVIDRQERSYRPTAAFKHLLIHRVRASLAALGRRPEPGSWLGAQIDEIGGSRPPRGTLYSWGPRLRVFVESGDLGAEFEALVRAFEAEHLDPASVDPIVSEFYIALAHARIHQVLRAPPAERSSRLAAVERALADLRAMKRNFGRTSHALYVDGFVASYQGRSADARQRMAEAEIQAEREDCPWVLYAIARTRAHRLRDEGKLAAAHDQARVAETLARQHGAEPRARWIREEFGLASSAVEVPVGAASVDRPRDPSGRQLAALLRLLHAPDLRPEQQAAAMLDDLLGDLGAERAFLLFRPDGGGRSSLLIGRDARGDEWPDVEAWRLEWLEGVRESGAPWPADGVSSRLILGHPVDPERLVAAPLSLGGKAVGAVCLERSRGAPTFTPEEHQMLLVLSRQMPVSLEIAQLFVERDQLHASLRQAQKMEAVGQLAGGLAHDFNNMLAAIRASLDAIRERSGPDPAIHSEAELIADVTQRAGRLMRQLLSFSRQQGASPVLCSVNDLIVELRPMLQRLAGDQVKVALRLDPDVGEVRLGRSSFDQAMVNLVVNSRDAMPAGGTVTITTHEIRPGEGGAPVGPTYLRIDVTDTGHGISPDHVQQIFDPFFTTKPVGSGTGIGLTTVYAFVRDSGGYVEVNSAPGVGTTLSMFFPAVEDQPGEATSRRVPKVTGTGSSVPPSSAGLAT